MSRLAGHGVVDLNWTEDEDTVYADGLQSYEIDTDNELAIFHGPKCVRVVPCSDFSHAISVIHASEAVCRWYIRQGSDGKGHKVTERGWVIK